MRRHPLLRKRCSCCVNAGPPPTFMAEDMVGEDCDVMELDLPLEEILVKEYRPCQEWSLAPHMR